MPPDAPGDESCVVSEATAEEVRREDSDSRMVCGRYEGFPFVDPFGAIFVDGTSIARRRLRKFFHFDVPPARIAQGGIAHSLMDPSEM